MFHHYYLIPRAILCACYKSKKSVIRLNAVLGVIVTISQSSLSYWKTRVIMNKSIKI